MKTMKKRLEPYLDTDLENLEGEVWESVYGFDGYYQVSNLGRVKSESRYTNTGQRLTGRVLKQKLNTGAARVEFSVDGIHTSKLVSNLVAEVFLREKKDNECITFKNRNPLDCRLSNLEIITISLHRERMYKEGHYPHLEIGIGRHGNVLQLDKFGVYDGGVLVKRICSQCFIETELDQFRGGNLFCNKCALRRMGVVDIGRNERIKELRDAGLKKCPKCQKIKKIDTQFWKGRSRCIECESQ